MPSKPVKTATFRSGKFKLILDEHWEGLCNCDVGELEDPNYIYVSNRLKGQARLDCLLHEMIHAHDPMAPEEYVGRLATDMARVLHRLGYRIPGDQ